MLVLAGCTLGPEVMVMLDEPLNNKLYDTHLDIRKWVINMLHSPKALQQMCRETTRKHLPMIYKLGKLESLPVPQRIVKYLNLSDVEELLSFFQGLNSGELTSQEMSVGIWSPQYIFFQWELFMDDVPVNFPITCYPSSSYVHNVYWILSRIMWEFDFIPSSFLNM